MQFTLKQIAHTIGAHLIGDGEVLVKMFSAINDIQPNSLVVANGEENFILAEQSEALAIVTNMQNRATSKSLLILDNPSKD